MIDGLKPYPRMKDSGVAWLGEVPEHWEVEPLGRSIRVTSGDMIAIDDERESGIPIYGGNGIRGYTFKSNSRGPAVLLGRVGAKCGCVHLVDGPFWASEHALRVILQKEVDLKFLAVALGHADLNRLAIRTAQPLLNSTIVRTHRVAVPSLPEQAAIVRFLDQADRLILRCIRAKQKLIAFLEEQKQAIINGAVTLGLDPNARLKSSGVAWLGDVPEHWEVTSLRRRWTVTDCKHLTVPFLDGDEGFPLASVREVQSFTLSLSNAKRTSQEHYERLIEGGRAPAKGDLIYCRNVSVGAASVVATEEPFAMGQDVCLIRSARESQWYLNYFLRSPAMKRQLALLLVGATFDRINVADIKALMIVVPPRREQDEIVDFLNAALAESMDAQKAVTSEIALLREFRTRLIADVVTGKLDVREAAARLPDHSDDTESLDLDEADIPPDDEDLAADDLDALVEPVEA